MYSHQGHGSSASASYPHRSVSSGRRVIIYLVRLSRYIAHSPHWLLGPCTRRVVHCPLRPSRRISRSSHFCSRVAHSILPLMSPRNARGHLLLLGPNTRRIAHSLRRLMRPCSSNNLVRCACGRLVRRCLRRRFNLNFFMYRLLRGEDLVELTSEHSTMPLSLHIP